MSYIKCSLWGEKHSKYIFKYDKTLLMNCLLTVRSIHIEEERPLMHWTVQKFSVYFFHIHSKVWQYSLVRYRREKKSIFSPDQCLCWDPRDFFFLLSQKLSFSILTRRPFLCFSWVEGGYQNCLFFSYSQTQNIRDKL